MSVHGTGRVGGTAVSPEMARTATDGQMLEHLIANWDQLTQNQGHHISKEDLRRMLPEGPAKHALLDHFEAILLLSDYARGGQMRGDDRIAASQIDRQDLQELMMHVDQHGDIGRAMQALASELMTRNDIHQQGHESPLDAIRTFVERLQDSLGAQDDKIRGFYQEFFRLADFRGNRPDIKSLSALGQRVREFLDGQGMRQMPNRGQRSLEALLGRILARAQDSVADRMDKARDSSVHNFQQLSEFLNTARAVDSKGSRDLLDPLRELMDRIADQIGDVGDHAMPGDVDFEMGMATLLSADDLASSFKALGDLLGSGVEALAEHVPDTANALRGTAERQQADHARSSFRRSYEDAQKQLRPLTNYAANRLIGSGERPEDGLHESLYGLPENINVQALVQWVMREAYLDVTKDLKDYADKLKYHMAQKKAIREEIAQLRDVRAGYAGAEPGAKLDDKIQAQGYTESYDMYKRTGSTTTGPDKKAEKIDTVEGLDAHLKNLEEKLQTVGEDMQLAQTDLQNIMQKQQQTLQLMSNISKMVHDTSMAIIRKIG